MIYVAKFTKSVYVLHAFQKKSHKTRAADIALAAQRFKQMKVKGEERTSNQIERQRACRSGFEPAEAQVLALRADLMVRLSSRSPREALGDRSHLDGSQREIARSQRAGSHNGRVELSVSGSTRKWVRAVDENVAASSCVPLRRCSSIASRTR